MSHQTRLFRLVAELCPTFFNPMDCSPPGSSVHGILQARILEWNAIPFSRGSSQARDWTWISCIACRFFTDWATGKPFQVIKCLKKQVGDGYLQECETVMTNSQWLKSRRNFVLVALDLVCFSVEIGEKCHCEGKQRSDYVEHPLYHTRAWKCFYR